MTYFKEFVLDPGILPWRFEARYGRGSVDFPRACPNARRVRWGDPDPIGDAEYDASMKHRIPPLYHAEATIRQLAEKVGQVIGVEVKAVSNGKGDFHQTCVKLEALKPLVRFVTLAPEGRDRMMLQVKYEKIPRFCGHCGLMGHIHMECGTGEFKSKDLHYGDWMMAEQNTWRTGTPRVRPMTYEQRRPKRDTPQGSIRGGASAERGRGGGRGGGRTEMSRETVWRTMSYERI